MSGALGTQYFADGTWWASSGNASIDVVNPASGDLLASVTSCTAEDIDVAVSAARAAAPGWAARPTSERVALLRALRAAIATAADELESFRS